jgi:metallo-beta-lactamase class B
MRILFAAAAASVILSAQNYTPANPDWNKPIPPFRIVGNIFYVGTNEIASYLFTSPQGHVLIDGGFRESVPIIVENLKQLGMGLKDIKYLLNTQAHYDHAAGLAELKRLTGAQLLASAEDAKLLARGGRGDFAFGDTYPYEPVTADKIVKHGEFFSNGAFTLTAHITPGHTKGCTTWSTSTFEGSRQVNVVVLCSVSAPGYKLKSNPKYPNIVQDFESTFDYLEKLPCEVLLAPHASQWNMDTKRGQMVGYPNPFIEPGELARYIQKARSEFRSRLTAEK